ncbi:MAG: hypothetical protein QXZ02_08005 [Candidatus Bathyarchaeia archaeon]
MNKKLTKVIYEDKRFVLMPISVDEFNRGKVKGCLEDQIISVLNDNKAYTLDELAKELRIGLENEDAPSLTSMDKAVAAGAGANTIKDFRDISNYMKDFLNNQFLRDKLNDMVKEGKIVSRFVEGKDGKYYTYYKINQVAKLK